MAAEETVGTIIEDARNFAQSSYDSAADLIASAQSAAQSFVTLSPRSLNFSAPDPASVDLSADPGVFQDGFAMPAGKPSAPDLVALHIPELPTFPEAPAVLDTSGLFQFDRPVFDIGGFTKTAPVVDTDVTFPEAPQVVEYEAPSTTPLSLRDTPAATVPTFDPDLQMYDPGEAPDLAEVYRTRLTDAVPQFRDWVETYADAWLHKYAPEYHSAMATLEAKIADGYTGTALPDTIEQQIFDRGVARAEDHKVAMDTEAAERFARRGYRLPPVALGAMLARNQEAVARAVSEVSRDTAIERARMEIQHVQFVMQLSATIRDGLRGQVLQYASLLVNINGQALQDAQQLVGACAEAYRLMIARAQLDQEQLRTLAVVFETQMKAALADIEIFKVEMEAAKLRKDAELSDVEVWAKKIDAQNLRINLYLAQLKAVTEKVGIERLRVDIFGEEVRAYTALVGAKTAEFGAYRAAIDGDEARVRAYAEQVRAYGVGTDAARTKVQAEAALTDVGVQYNRNLIEVFDAELRGWVAEIDAENKRFGTSADVHRLGLERYRAYLAAQIDELKTQYEASRLDLDGRRAQTDADVRTLLAQANLLQQRMNLIAQTAMSGASAHGAMAASAVSAQNTMVSLANETVNS